MRANPQAFVSWILGDAQFLGELPEKLKTWNLEVDALLRASVKGQQMLLHIEFQAYNDLEMAERLLRYNVLARSEYKLPVVSCVIYLLRDGKVPSSQLTWDGYTGGYEQCMTYYEKVHTIKRFFKKGVKKDERKAS